MVLSIDPLEAYIAREGLVRFCTEPYEAPKKDNLSNLLMHLTNYSLNKLSSKFSKPTDIDDADASKQSLSTLFDTLGDDSESLFSQIQDTVAKTLLGLQPFMIQANEAFFDGKLSVKGTCWQILGFDIFIDERQKAWLLEINDHPSLNINHEMEGPKGLIKTPSAVDRFVKTTILGDAIKLVFKKNRPDDFGCWR